MTSGSLRIYPSSNNAYRHYHVTGASGSVSWSGANDYYQTIVSVTGAGYVFQGKAASGSASFTTTGYSSPLYVNAWDTSGSGGTISLSGSASYNYGSKFVPTVSISKISGYVAPTKAFTESCSLSTAEDIQAQYSMSSGTLHYKRDDASGYTDIGFSGTSCTVPANTFVTGHNYDVYVTAVLDDGSTVDSAHATLNTVDAAGSVTALSPKNEVLEGTAVFSWQYQNTYGSDQLAADLQYSMDGGSNWIDIWNHNVTTSTTSGSVTMPSAGTVSWRVRGYNQDNVATAWSDTLSFLNNIPPEAPTISAVELGGRPTVKWSTNNQISYEVVVLDSAGTTVWSSGETYTADKFCLINEYLKNGAYTIKVRISNVYGKKSDWASVSYTQNMTLPVPAATLSALDDGVQIDITNNDSFAYYYLYRKGVCVAKITKNTYIDKFVDGLTEYTIRGITSDDYFSDLIISINYKASYTRMIAIDGTIFDCSNRWDNMVGIQENETVDNNAVTYLGDTYPTHNVSDARSRNVSLTCVDPGIRKYMGETMYYADFRGIGGWVKVTGLGRSSLLFDDETVFNCEFTEYDEAIEYEI